jgi:hypothetical protein
MKQLFTKWMEKQQNVDGSKHQSKGKTIPSSHSLFSDDDEQENVEESGESNDEFQSSDSEEQHRPLGWVGRAEKSFKVFILFLFLLCACLCLFFKVIIFIKKLIIF